MINLLILGFGGFIGAISRYLVSGWAQDLSRSVGFPYGTLAVNLTGCFLLGVLSQMVERGFLDPQIRLFAMVGMLGAFTTFSTFSLETINLLQDGELSRGFANLAANNLLGLAAVLIGKNLVFAIWR